MCQEQSAGLGQPGHFFGEHLAHFPVPEDRLTLAKMFGAVEKDIGAASLLVDAEDFQVVWIGDRMGNQVTEGTASCCMGDRFGDVVGEIEPTIASGALSGKHFKVEPCGSRNAVEPNDACVDSSPSLRVKQQWCCIFRLSRTASDGGITNVVFRKVQQSLIVILGGYADAFHRIQRTGRNPKPFRHGFLGPERSPDPVKGEPVDCFINGFTGMIMHYGARIDPLWKTGAVRSSRFATAHATKDNGFVKTSVDMDAPDQGSVVNFVCGVA